MVPTTPVTIEPAASGPAAPATIGTAPPGTPGPAQDGPAAEDGRTQTDSLQTQGSVTVGDTIASGRIIAGYRIEGLLGKGGMGQVYRAVQLSVQRQVAFKVLARRLAANPSFRERFLREARAAGRLHHYHLITVHDVGEADGLMFFSMEIVEGRTVRDMLQAGPLPPELAVDLALQTLTALAYAHQNGLIHRDIKPDNLMVTAAGVVKIADLGLSRVSGDWEQEAVGAESTQAGTLMGTPHYMPPEQSRDAHAADERSDLYALGATLYHMLVGKPPFTGKSVVEVMMKAASEPVRFPEPGPSPLTAYLERMLAKRPEDRYPDARAAMAALESARPGRAGMASHPRRRSRRRELLRRQMRRLLSQPLAWIMLSVVLAVLAIALVLRHPSGQELDPGVRMGISSLIDQGHFRQALERIDSELVGIAKGSPAERELQKDRDLAQSQWDIASMSILQPAFDRFDQAVAGHRLNDAAAALHIPDQSELSPITLASLDAKKSIFEEQLVSMADAGGKPPSDPDREQLGKRDAESLTAGGILAASGRQAGGLRSRPSISAPPSMARAAWSA